MVAVASVTGRSAERGRRDAQLADLEEGHYFAR